MDPFVIVSCNRILGEVLEVPTLLAIIELILSKGKQRLELNDKGEVQEG